EKAARLVPPMTIGQAPFLVRKLVLDGRSMVGAKPPGSHTLLVGVPASPGRISGRVRVVRDPDAAVLQPGEVLVAPITAPAWTPLFATAAAVVTDVGSALAHASVIAREYGIPAVVGCGDATSRLKDGQLVTVGGGAGLIEDAAGVSDAPSSSGGVA
ncbi:MAG: pyruvate, water dikinase, partial [Pseudonocardiaceae bacterium]|nr:pyruvate, water dikinase [Pseudonocardiaceae bacterium]